MKIKTIASALAVALSVTIAGCQKGSEDYTSTVNPAPDTASVPSDNNNNDQAPTPEVQAALDSEDIADHIRNDDSLNSSINEEITALGCVKATTNQKVQVNLGLSKKEEFLQKCAKETNNSFWCDQVVHPNVNSASTFSCTYGSSQTHALVHPDEKTWKYPIQGIKILQALTAKGFKVNRIYNWWRPEPYNKNVGGAAGRHPYGTAIDVRFASNSEAIKAFRELCVMRKQKRLRALGYYGSSSLHLGIGDRLANTWGKSCN